MSERAHNPTKERVYDIVEIDRSGPIWRGAVKGYDAALVEAAQIGTKTQNEIRVIYVPEHAVVAVVNQKGVKHVEL